MPKSSNIYLGSHSVLLANRGAYDGSSYVSVNAVNDLGWTPADLTDIQYYWVPEYGLTTRSGNEVTSWESSVGSLTLSLTGTDTGPIYSASISDYKGQPGLNFGGGSVEMSSTTISNANVQYFFYVAAFNTDATTLGMLGGRESANSGTVLLATGSAVTGSDMAYRYYDGGSNTATGFAHFDAPYGAWFAHICITEVPSIVSNYKVWKNSDIVYQPKATGIGFGGVLSGPVKLGHGLNATILECGITTQIPTTDEELLIRAYLNRRYGIQGY